ncbi:MAG: hypothetical protein MK198_11510 [Gracilimonas sp.]|uniref:hypothetical protein n=1 Tax=Gracilimonas sp. TaxID=1974203 RepID=UPI003753DD65|nr:hypothetical protein [Gracilimonas sp.]
MKFVSRALFYICFLAYLPLKAQNVTLTGTIYDYATYYVSSFDPQTGASDFQLFRYTLSSDSYPVWIKVTFRATMLSPALGINTETAILDLYTSPFPLEHDIILDNRDLSTTTTELRDVTGAPINLSVYIQDVIDVADLNAMLSSIMTTGRLADGNYTFQFGVASGSTESACESASPIFETRTIVVESPSAINLEYPGGALSDTSSTEVFTTYPLLVWSSSSCNRCASFVRVAEFNPSVHSSVDEAIQDERRLPFDQAQEWENIGIVNSYQYPLSGALPLEYGKVYVWQVKHELTTTAGSDELLSPIYAFRIQDVASGTTTTSYHPIVRILQQVLSEDQFNSLFGPSAVLDGFSPSGSYRINGDSDDLSAAISLLNQITNGTASITNVEVQD